MSGLDLMKARMYAAGGYREGRMVKGKLKNMKRALWRSYQAEWITMNGLRHRCLINPDKMSNDYDQKIISIEYESGIKEGDTFYWDRTGTYWIAYLQQHTEEAYFRARVRRCDYEIEVNNKKYPVYVRGPVETTVRWNQKHKTEFNDLNYSVLLYITKNEETTEFFSRFRKVMFEGHRWQVAATDKYSTQGIIEVYLAEDYDNEFEDAEIPTIDSIIPDKEAYIDGPQVVYPYDSNISYSIVGISSGKFVVNSTKVKIVEQNESSCVLNILTGKAGEFIISYENEENEPISLKVVIDSL